ncbi:MAG: TolC family protein [Candidatus Zixiibacteriota bacterium]|nr:MAG: TolC family protein [candidate division Zixibacteria bacterium]
MNEGLFRRGKYLRNLLSRGRHIYLPALLAVMAGIMLSMNALARTITLEEALDIAINQTARAGMVVGNLEVSEQNYFARRINFYLPEISIKGAVPSYSVDESYRFFGGATKKRLYKTRDLGFNSFIELNQSLLTGGDVIVTANLLSREDRYPNTRPDVPYGTFIDEITRQGYFTFSYTQPLLKASSSKYELNNTRDDYEMAKLARIEEETALKKEVVEAFMGMMQMSIRQKLYTDKLESARLQVGIDSIKLIDGVISEEDFLLSRSEHLDAELDQFEIETSLEEKRRELAILLDWDVESDLIPVEPSITDHIDDTERQEILNSWESSVPIGKAQLQYSKAKREADYRSSGHGLTGDLTADYSTGQGNVRVDGAREEIDTRGWGVSLNFSYPLWDGGSSGAAVKAAKLQAQQAKLEFDRQKQNTRAEIINLVNQLDVSYRRLGIMQKQVELAQIRLDIAQNRLSDGQISEITYLESEVFWLESKDQYLEELKKYLLNRIEIAGKFISE